MPRVTAADVQGILPAAVEAADIWSFIETAAVVVDEELANTGLSPTRLRLIELYLSAHFVSVRDPTVSEVRSEREFVKLALPPLGEGLRSTTYGQQALQLDTTGTLALVGMATRASFAVW